MHKSFRKNFFFFAIDLKKGKRFGHIKFNLMEKREEEIMSVRYKGGWTFVNNGYLRWPTTMPPMKLPPTYAEMLFSKWLERMRKDVECTFGILKGMFRILKTGIPLHGIVACDWLWKIYYAFYIFLWTRIV